jgi:hypothetical protein
MITIKKLPCPNSIITLNGDDFLDVASGSTTDVILEYENGEWFIGARIYFPDGTILSLENKIEKDGWMWHDEPPREYLEWKEN